LKRLRIVSIVLAAVIALPINAISAPANAAVTFVNTIPLIDPNLSTLVNGGVIGDKIRFTQTGVSSAVVTFAGTSNNTATASRVGLTDTWEFTVPSGAKLVQQQFQSMVPREQVLELSKYGTHMVSHM
jgi:hypothetical protein